ncbi:UNVERIFIED_CONTAM: hypothetical protein GTU68_059037 [Idotea baltica]|nr:hypothetical protein [Idotea baltica]
MPLKYLAGNAFLVKFLGMPHGMLFLAYIVLAIVVKFILKWDLKTTCIVLIAAIIPFGTFYVNKKYF